MMPAGEAAISLEADEAAAVHAVAYEQDQVLGGQVQDWGSQGLRDREGRCWGRQRGGGITQDYQRVLNTITQNSPPKIYKSSYKNRES